MRHRTLQEYRGAALDVGAGERGAGLGRGCQRVGERARPERSHGKCAVGMGVQVGKTGQGEPRTAAAVVASRLDFRNPPIA
jgi:hypothetical protein